MGKGEGCSLKANLGKRERERERAKKETKGGMGWKGGRKMERKVELVVRA